MKRAFLALLLCATAAQAQLVCPNNPPTREEKGPVRRPGYDLTTEEFDQWLLNVRYLCENAGTGGSGGGASMCSDLTDATSYGCALVAAASVAAQRTALGLGTAATKDVPASGDASSSQVVKGDDSRLTDARTPIDDGSFALLAGRSGGQTLLGGSLATESLFLGANAADGVGTGSTSVAGPYIKLGGNDKYIRMIPGTDGDIYLKSHAGTDSIDLYDGTLWMGAQDVVHIGSSGALEFVGSTVHVAGPMTVDPGNAVTADSFIGTASVAATGDSATAFFSSGTMEAARGGTGSSTVPSAGQLPVGNAGGTAYAPQSVSGDATMASTGALTLASVVSASTCGDATHSCGLTYDAKGRITAATNNAISGGSGISGATGSTDNALLRADGTGGSTAQGSALSVSDYVSTSPASDYVSVDPFGADSIISLRLNYVGTNGSPGVYGAGILINGTNLGIQNSSGTLVVWDGGGSIQPIQAKQVVIGTADANGFMLRQGTGQLEATTGNQGAWTGLAAAYLKLNDNGTRPTCDSTARGTIWMDNGGAGVADTVAACCKKSDDTWTWSTAFLSSGTCT